MKRSAVALATGAGIAALIALPLVMPRQPRAVAPNPQAVVTNVRVPVQPPAPPSNVASQAHALLGEITLEAVAMASAAPCPSMLDCGVRDKCLPPATFRNTCAQPPFDAPVRFGGEVRLAGPNGVVYWQWMKAGDASRPCTPAQAGDRSSYQFACAAKLGEPLYVTRRFK